MNELLAKDMTLKDYIAVKVLQVLLESENAWSDDQYETAYRVADLMIKERNKETT
jgi:hypothetical protein